MAQYIHKSANKQYLEFDYAHFEDNSYLEHLALASVFKVTANSDYDVTKTEARNGIIALRTIEGSGRLQFPGPQEIRCFPGSLIFFNHKEIHRYFCEKDLWYFWWFNFRMPVADLLPLNQLFTLPLLDYNEILVYLEILGLLKKHNPKEADIGSALFHYILQKWLYQLESQKEHSPDKQVMLDIIHYLQDNLKNQPSVTQMAYMAGMSERKFRTVFTKYAGCGPKQYSENLKLTMAEGLLRNTHLRIGEIANQLGYCSAFHFSKAFKRSKMVSPRSFRNIKKG